MVRVLHFSDPHLEGSARGLGLREWAGKRAVAFVAHRLVRRRRFVEAGAKLETLARFARAQAVDLAVCTGDLTAFGTEPELALARRALEPFRALPLGVVTVPGNHDIYLPRSVRDRRFERHLGDLLGSDRPDLASEGPWPVVRLPAEGVAVVALNSARPNPPLWRSSGRVSRAQLAGLRAALGDPEVRRRFVLVAMHHAPRLASGRRDRPGHGLIDAGGLRRALGSLKRGMLLHGHVHDRFHLAPACFGVPIFGAGSATHGGREGIWVYDVERSGGVRARPGRWDGRGYRLEGPPIQVAGFLGDVGSGSNM